MPYADPEKAREAKRLSAQRRRQAERGRPHVDPLSLRLDPASPLPAYRQIADGLRALLATGALSPGAQLPPGRTLAARAGVHWNTVAEAYRLLAEEGWLDLRRRRGAVVLNRPRRKPPAGIQGKFRRRLGELVAGALSEGMDQGTLEGELRAEASRTRTREKP